ncbi:MAG: hypothetical protein DI536_22305 [Archangium gephyra]|uniref:Pilin n=1 Tax=Archangium gephyra TaxID=48 RepID=A0A2W5T5W7_9BACT|nr:MAG: hypothetical protein DI536_22305 [Archangium gephyra]
MLPVVALVLSVVGLCAPPISLISLGLGVYCFVRARKEAAWAPRKQISQMTMVVSGVGLAVFALIVLPRIKELPARRQQVACREGLSLLYAQQQELKRTNGRYTTQVVELAKKPEAGAQLYRLDGNGPLAAVGLAANVNGIDEHIPQLVRDAVGLKDGQLTMLCAAQLDADATVDVWTISTFERTGDNGAKIPAGLPWLDVDDVTR